MYIYRIHISGELETEVEKLDLLFVCFSSEVQVRFFVCLHSIILPAQVRIKLFFIFST